jgi:hypothetical protein
MPLSITPWAFVLAVPDLHKSANCLRCLPRPAIDPQLRDNEDLLSASITLDDAQPLFLEFQKAGVIFHQPIRTEPWGARGSIVRDPDGNLIMFAGRGFAGRGDEPVTRR